MNVLNFPEEHCFEAMELSPWNRGLPHSPKTIKEIGRTDYARAGDAADSFSISENLSLDATQVTTQEAKDHRVLPRINRMGLTGQTGNDHTRR